MAEQPALNRIYVLGYSANDRDYPIVSLTADPRVAGYQVPKDLSACPDKRYPNHVFTGAQPIAGDQRVRHVWEILPSPWVPFTRYDDDLGPVQGRRRSVKNEGQVASLTADKRTTYEAREGSAIVYTELEETWSVATDDDGNSLFPIRDRDFYDPSRGPVQERRQLFVPTGEEEGSLENVNGVITQTSYEPYNEFLSVKIVQTYKVNGPQLIGKATDNDGQLVTVTTQRKGADGYIPPNPTATRTVEVSREDAESLVERIVDTPAVFNANTFSVERPDPIPQKFRVLVPTSTTEQNLAGTAQQPSLTTGDISKSEQQINKFVKRVSASRRDSTQLPRSVTQKTTTNEGLLATVTETLQRGDTATAPTATKSVQSEALGDGTYVVTVTNLPKVFEGKTISVEKSESIPVKFRAQIPAETKETNIAGEVASVTISGDEISKSEQQITEFVKRISTTTRSNDQLPVSLTQKTTNQEKQLVTVTETLQSGDTNEQPTSRIDIQSEAIGDGKYVVTKTESPEVFKAQVYRAEKTDLTPPKFRAKQTELVTEENVEGNAEPITTLGENEFLKSEQQINKFVKRVTTNTRNTDLNESINELVITQDGQLATRTITLSKSPQVLFPSATTIDGNVEELGDGRTIKTEVSVNAVFDERQESLEKPEVIPPEFRASLQNKTISEIKAGESVEIPILSQDELSKTIQRITEHKIRETRIIRPSTNYPSLSGQLVDNDLIKVSRVRTVAKGNQTITPSATVSGTVEALGDGYTLKTEDTREKVFEAKTFSQEKPDNIPVEFRVEKPATTEEYNEEGSASEVSLTDTEIAKSEQQVNEFVKRIRTTTRDDVGNVVLSEEQIDQDGVKVAVERKLSKEQQTITPSETVRGQVQNLGGGYTVKTTLTRNEVLELPSFSVEKPNVVPAAFRSQLPTTTEEKTVAGNAEQPTLNDKNISKTERQIDKFLKRTTTVSRPESVSGELVGEQIENDGIKSVVTRTLSDSPQFITPSATISGNVEEVGDGLTIKTEIQKDKTFDNKTISVSKPEVLPERFRASIPTVTTQEIVEKQEIEEEPILESGDLEKSETRITDFTVRKSTTSRDISTTPTLDGMDYEESFDVQIPYTETIQQTIPTGSAEAVPLDDQNFLVREYDADDIESYLSSFLQTHPTTISMNLPRVLESITVEWDEKQQSGEYVNTPYADGTLYQFSNSDKGEASAFHSAAPLVSLIFKDVWSQNIPATVHIFFLKNPVTESEILSKTNAQRWPTFKPKSHVITGKGVEVRATATAAASISVQQSRPSELGGYTDQSRQSDYSRSVTPITINIPPCLHSGFNINETKSLTATVTTIARTAAYGIFQSLTQSSTATANDVAFVKGSSGPTSPSTIPTSGIYLVDSSVEFFKYGFSIVRATTIDASVFA